MRDLQVKLPAGVVFSLRLVVTRAGRPVPEGVPPAECAWWDLQVFEPLAVPRQRASAQAPNLLVVCVDTLAARRVSLLAYDRPTTPALTALAARGTLWTSATSPSSWTVPATASLFTGLPPVTHGVPGDRRRDLLAEMGTWPDRIQRMGVPGAAFVANPLVARSSGFSEWQTFDGDPQADMGGLLDAAIRWIDEQPSDARWFAYVHPMDPHAPYGAPDGFRDRFVDPGHDEVRQWDDLHPRVLNEGVAKQLTPAQRQHAIDLYDGELAYLDHSLDAFLRQLDQGACCRPPCWPSPPIMARSSSSTAPSGTATRSTRS